MKTLIELYDKRPIENVLATEVFSPDRTVYLCPAEIAHDKKTQEKLKKYFSHRGVDTELIFLESSLHYTDKLLNQLRSVTEKYGDCIADITGGTDAALFACGQFSAEQDLPTFTYSWKKNSFYDIHNAPFARDLPCPIMHDVEDCFLMAGGAMRTGRVDNAILNDYLEYFDPFFRLYLKHRTKWTKIIKYIQQASQVKKGEPIFLAIEAERILKDERGSKVEAPADFLKDIEKLGFISDLKMDGDIFFAFKDAQVRTWLRDIGSVLELYVYKACLDTGVFNDVRTSAVVDWEGDFKQDNVSNEIDVMAMRGIIPVFISCKTCEINTEALNELAILRDRFGGDGAKAAIVTSQYCRSVTRHRASELNIEVIDLNDLRAGRIRERIIAAMN